MVVSFVIDAIGMDETGNPVPVSWDTFKTARRVVSIIKDCIKVILDTDF